MRRGLAVALVVAPVCTLAAVAASAPRVTDVVPCSLAIRQSARPTGVTGLRLVLGRIWLPRRTVQLARARLGWDRFGKVGIVVRAGSPVVLEVPPKWRGVYSLEYAPKHVQTVADGSIRLSVRACAGALGRWSAYAGGYVVSRPQCVPLIVRADGRTARIHVAIGRRCTQEDIRRATHSGRE
jgi:hypothetical protein